MSNVVRDVGEHARFGGLNAQRDLLDFSLAACLIHQGRTREAKTILAITRPRALQKDIISGYIEHRLLRLWR